MLLWSLLICCCAVSYSEGRSVCFPGNKVFPASKVRSQEIDLTGLDLSHYYKKPNRTVGAVLANWNYTKGGSNPEEFENDMIYPYPQGRNAINNKAFLWENGTLPYEISDNFNERDVQNIMKIIKQFHLRTCIRFVKRTDEINYITFENTRTGCWSSIGRVGGRQIINLQAPECLYMVGTGLHECMHALGFFHEHTRFDRDQYIDIIYSNIRAEKVYNFMPVAEAKTMILAPYDLHSVMHYSQTAFSKDEYHFKTIEVKNKNRRVSQDIGQRGYFSAGDLVKIKALYCS